MSVTRFFYEPYYPLSEFDSLFDEAFSARGNQGQRRRSNNQGSLLNQSIKPRMDLHESGENALTATFELPGLKKEDIDISVHNNHLTISGESKAATDTNQNGYAVRERQFGRFSRTLQLPQGVKDDEIKASMEHGILSVTFPKSTPELAPKKITVS